MRANYSPSEAAAIAHRLAAIAGFIAFFVHTLVAVHVGRWILASVGMIVLPATFLVARRLGATNRAPQEPILVMLVAFLAFAMPVATLPSPRGPGFLSAAIGIATVYVIWGGLRYVVVQTGSQGVLRDIAWGLGWGAAMALGYSLVASAILLVAAVEPGSSDVLDRLPLVLGSYWVAGSLGGLLVGALRPLTGWPLTRMVVGFLVAFSTYTAVGVAIQLSGDPEFGDASLGDLVLIGVIAGFLVGPPAALGTVDW